MKFLCDRCQTRYSIGDERVRGKILKIRCKTCANVITVREGMTADAGAAPPAAPEYPGRAKKSTTMVPPVLGEGSEPARGPDDPAHEGKVPGGDSFAEPRCAMPPAPGIDPAPIVPHLPASSMLPGTGATPAGTSAAVAASAPGSGSDGDDDLAIGEVSRVVKLADLSRAPRDAGHPVAGHRGRTAPVAGGHGTGASPVPRRTAPFPGGSPPGGSPGSAQDGAPAASVAGDPGTTMAPIMRAHRRGLIVLISVAGVMVLGVAGAVVLFVATGDDPIGGNLRQVHNIDTSRPEDPISHRPVEPVGPQSPAPPDHLGSRPTPRLPRPTPNPAGRTPDPNPPPGNSLRGEEIEDVARKHQDMTQRCYLRSQRGADAILVGDVKKIAVTLVIDKDGNVSDVQLSDHAADNLGRCLSSSLRSWKFRQSPGGTFRFSLNFVSG